MHVNKPDRAQIHNQSKSTTQTFIISVKWSEHELSVASIMHLALASVLYSTVNSYQLFQYCIA